MQMNILNELIYVKSKIIAIWLNINPIGAPGKSTIMEKKDNKKHLSHRSHIQASEILEQLWKKSK